MFITPDNVNVFNLEFTDYCNAACPMCSRFKWDGTLYKEKVNQNHTSLKALQKNVPEKIIKQLKNVISIGTYGDPIMSPECLHIYRWIRELNPDCKLEFHSNGGTRNEKFWQECAELGIRVVFGIDGLEDTNHLYRRNVNWKKLISNVKSFIDAGGKADWKYIAFKHNENQIESAKALSETLGFKSFGWQYSDRWKESNWITGETHDIKEWPVDDYYIQRPDSQEDKIYHEKTVQLYEEKQFNHKDKIVCQMAMDQSYEIYIRANGNVQPCCMLGDLDVHEAKNLISDPKEININYTNLVEILNGEFFKRLDNGINNGSKDRLKNCFYTCRVKG